MAELGTPSGPLDEAGSAPEPGVQPGAPQAARGRGPVVTLGIVAALLAVIVLYIATGTGAGDTGGAAASAHGDPIAVLDEAQAAGRPAFVLAHSAT